MKLSIEFVLVTLTAMFSPCTPQPHSHLRKPLHLAFEIGIGKWLLKVSQRLRASRVCPPSVAFPNRKSIIFDNKLDFSDRKIAIRQGFRYSNFKVASK